MGLPHGGIFALIGSFDEAAQPAVAAVRVGLVVEAADRGEDAAVAEVPLLDLVVAALDVLAEAPQVLVQARLDRLEPGLLRVLVGVDPAQHEEVVLDLLEDQRVDVAAGLVPVGRLARLERDQLDELARLLGPRERRDRFVPVVLARERVLELVPREVGCVLGLRVVALRGQLAVRLALLVALKPVVGDLPAGGNAVDDRAERMADPRRVGR